MTGPVLLSSKGIEVRREGVDGSRWYEDPDGSGALYTSVTTAIGATTSKPWLTPWAAKLAAECAVDHRDVVEVLLREAGRDAAVEFIKGEARRKREAAMETGTWVHDLVEALVLDATLPDFPDEVAPFADAFVDWHCQWNPTYLMSEATVANPPRGYAGTLDLGVYLPALDATAIIDVKSGANLDLYMPVQLAAYKVCPEVWLPFGQKAPMPRLDLAMILHLRPGGAKLIDVTAEANDEAFGIFLRMLELLSWKDRQGGRVGRVLYVPNEFGQQPPPLLEDLDGVPCRAALAAGGIYRLDDLANTTPEKLLGLTGFGVKSLQPVADLLASHALEMPDLAETIAELAEAEVAAEARRVALAEKRSAAHRLGAHDAKMLRGCPLCSPKEDTDGSVA